MGSLGDGFADELGEYLSLTFFDLAKHLGFAFGGVAVGDSDVGTAVFKFGKLFGSGLGTLAEGARGLFCGGASGMPGAVAFDIEGVGAVVEIVGGEHFVGGGVVEDELGIGGSEAVGGVGVGGDTGESVGGFLRSETDGAQELAAVDLDGDAVGGDEIVVVGVGGDVV